MDSRLQEYDILRVIGTLAVIAIHITAAYILILRPAYYINQFVRFAVPLFIIISGFLLYYLDSKRPFFRVQSFFARRFSRLLWPYLFWTLTYFVFALLVNRGPLSIKPLLIMLLGNLVWGTANYHLYFVIIILQLYVLYPLLRLAIDRQPLLWFTVSLLLSLTSQTILYFSSISMIHLPAAGQNLYLVAFPAWIFYFYFGMFCAYKNRTFKDNVLSNLKLTVSMWLLSLLILLLDSWLTHSYASSIRPSVILYATSTFILCLSLALQYKKPLAGWLSWISDQSFLIFLMHPLFLAFILRVAHVAIGCDFSGLTGMIGLYVLTVALTLAATYLLSLTPLVIIMGGVRPTGTPSEKIKPD